MRIGQTTISLEETGAFSALVNDFVRQDPFLRSFLQSFPSAESVAQAARARSTSFSHREALLQVMREGYKDLPVIEAVEENLGHLARTNTVTVCTAHQPGVFTGHLYFLYKTIHVLRVCREMNEWQDGLHYVPVFYLGSEDNDLEEIGELPLSGETLHWQSGQTGACGRMKTSGMEAMLNAVEGLLNRDRTEDRNLMDLFRRAYNGRHTLADATRIILHELFGAFGLLVLDADHPALKRLFLPVLRDELLHQRALPVVQETMQRLSSRYAGQAMPRPINLFYLHDGIRERIERQGDEWSVVNTLLRFSREQLESELDQHPERFSPNVILRPLYQETVLPNALFVGGGSELAYWMQLRDLFALYQVPFPVIQLRRSLLWVPAPSLERMQRLSLSWQTLFQGTFAYQESLVREHGSLTELSVLQGRVGEVLDEISHLSAGLSPSLHRSTEAHHTGIRKAMQRVQKKFLAQLRRQEQDQVARYARLREHLFPGGSLQERKEGFLYLYREMGPDLIGQILDRMTAFDQDLIILWPEG